MKKVLLLGFLICMTWTSPTLACTVNGKDWAGAVNGVLEAFKNGKYQDVKEIIKENIRVENGQEFQKLVSDLEEYEPDGFDKCRIFMREERPPIVENLFFNLWEQMATEFLPIYLLLTEDVNLRVEFKFFAFLQTLKIF
ncbi:hypothetical protein FIV06_30015 (plasmid) [Labrenzia sp. THAF191b]|uniref:hypothetical protein n=1 Tax=unclassified Labrenzia TaxID=2648686 RepID=UPI001268A266|nr:MULTISPECIES: hypothetical protein [unclassified Labrenzia]QFT01706.1 hypothetical protein FIV06_30015 [Labrenzia sp. THAF191b]QFT07911.1 hypothetical protein FIV05_29465 [Labrenzia sp. THAF191a]QFT19223.1 hypothetical protein FIV03_28320 [Labrenzia sp. THAF187b]